MSTGLCAGDDARITPLDPLDADAVLVHLPEWNAAKDVPALIDALRKLQPTAERAASMGLYEACASLRDLGMILGSLKRHDVEPAQAVPEVVAPLVALGRTCAMVPRDTVYQYGPWNPVGPRQRMYTRDPNEDGLIHCVRSAAPGVEHAIEALVEAGQHSTTSSLFAQRCRQAAHSVVSMVESISFARRNVDVTFFAKVLRPYFEPIAIEGQLYMGPAAAHLPLSVVDHLTWGSDVDHPTYRVFQEDSVHYAVPRWRELCAKTSAQPSLLTRVVAALHASDRGAPELLESARSVYAIMRVLLAFRGRHKTLADRAYDPSVRVYPVGSGGFSTDVVASILEVTRARAMALKEAVTVRHGVSLRPPADIATMLGPRGTPTEA